MEREPKKKERKSDKNNQYYIFGPWSFSIGEAARIIEEKPRPTVSLPVFEWANAFGLPGLETPGMIRLLGPGPYFDKDYAMTTDLSDPVIVATLVDKEGVASPLFIDGTHRLYRAFQEGVEELPAYVLTAEETEMVRRNRYLE
ncbi:hypothetical protein L6E12_03710 [Actinokineospora sp. PR83]|uniref:hypothetical protein n=1 Tax=Actinokineospora sp. PR83 TaxID=2884908 RepID=UPI001F3D39A7|nr:hypothetical protein [Actinokineospora sp. PR83]MCG8914895.1 hypothetical protein [Actinokineospora sp. PR83]